MLLRLEIASLSLGLLLIYMPIDMSSYMLNSTYFGEFALSFCCYSNREFKLLTVSMIQNGVWKMIKFYFTLGMAFEA
jgi:hypothetical protein